MANTYFQFKQFTVHQEKAAMKVCTDACLFGAWVAESMETENLQNVLDIGTGTGLLSLMIAQKLFPEKNVFNTSTNITAIEIEEGAASEASNNFKNSPRSKYFLLINTSLQDFSKATINGAGQLHPQFDLIISNPPFFEGDLLSRDDNFNIAAHSKALPWSTLLHEVESFLTANGTFYVIIPALRAYTMQKLAAEKGLLLYEEVVIYNAAKQKPFRVFQKFVKSDSLVDSVKRSNFYIKDSNNQYTEDFIKLLAPYYLHL